VKGIDTVGCFYVSVIVALLLSPVVCLGLTVWFYAHGRVPHAIFWLIATAIAGFVAARVWEEFSI
jgi:hypothetical protein